MHKRQRILAHRARVEALKHTISKHQDAHEGKLQVGQKVQLKNGQITTVTAVTAIGYRLAGQSGEFPLSVLKVVKDTS